MNEPSLGLGPCLTSSQLSAVSGLTPPPPHITSSHYVLATSSGTKQREQVFCLAEPPSSLASSWNIVELNKRGVFGSVPANMWEEACPRCLLCKPSVTLVTLESWLLKPFRGADIRPCKTLAEPTNFQKKFDQKNKNENKNKTTKKKSEESWTQDPTPQRLEAHSLEPSFPELPGSEKRLATSTPPAQRRSKSNRVHRTPLY